MLAIDLLEDRDRLVVSEVDATMDSRIRSTSPASTSPDASPTTFARSHAGRQSSWVAEVATASGVATRTRIDVAELLTRCSPCPARAARKLKYVAAHLAPPARRIRCRRRRRGHIITGWGDGPETITFVSPWTPSQGASTYPAVAVDVLHGRRAVDAEGPVRTSRSRRSRRRPRARCTALRDDLGAVEEETAVFAVVAVSPGPSSASKALVIYRAERVGNA